MQSRKEALVLQAGKVLKANVPPFLCNRTPLPQCSHNPTRGVFSVLGIDL